MNVSRCIRHYLPRSTCNISTATISCRTLSTKITCYSPSTIIKPARRNTISAGTSFRGFHVVARKQHNHLEPPKPGEELKITFVDKEGDEHTFDVAKGDNLLDIALEHDIEMEGACGGSCACSTCHIIVESEDMYEKMEEPDDDENDMLDLAFGLTETSRLGCQIKMSKDIDGLRVKLPTMTRNLQASDFSKPSGRDAAK